MQFIEQSFGALGNMGRVCKDYLTNHCMNYLLALRNTCKLPLGQYSIRTLLSPFSITTPINLAMFGCWRWYNWNNGRLKYTMSFLCCRETLISISLNYLIINYSCILFITFNIRFNSGICLIKTYTITNQNRIQEVLSARTINQKKIWILNGIHVKSSQGTRKCMRIRTQQQ